MRIKGMRENIIKRVETLLVFVSFFCLILPSAANLERAEPQGWSGVITVNPTSFDTLHPSVMQDSNGTIWIVFTYGGAGIQEIAYKTSTTDCYDLINEPIHRIPSGGYDYTDVGVGGTPHIMQAQDGRIWVTYNAGPSSSSMYIYYVTSMDNGTTWDGPTQVPNAGATNLHSAIAQTSDGTIMIAWTSNVDGDYEIYFSNSTDNGANWSSAGQVTSNTVMDSYPDLYETQDGRLWLVYHSEMAGALTRNIYYITTTDDGVIWTSPVKITYESGKHYCPSICQTSDGTIFVSFDTTHTGDPNSEIVYVCSFDNGETWSSILYDTDGKTVSKNSTTDLDQRPQIACTHYEGYEFVWFFWYTVVGIIKDCRAREAVIGLLPVNVTHSFNLAAGWNFISLVLSNASLNNASALASAIGANCTHVANWSGESFQTYAVATGAGNFNLEASRGYNVYVTAYTTFTMSGSKVASTTLTLTKGWNSIGRFSTTIANASALAASVDNCTAVAYWNGTLGRFVVHPAQTSISNFAVEKGEGYLVYVASTTTWENS